MAQDCLAGLEKKEISTMESIRFRDISVNKFTNYCARILVQKGHKNHMKTPVYYHIIRELERLGDCYKEIAEYSISSDQHVKKETLKNLQKTNTYFEELYSLFYKFYSKNCSKSMLITEGHVGMISQ